MASPLFDELLVRAPKGNVNEGLVLVYVNPVEVVPSAPVPLWVYFRSCDQVVPMYQESDITLLEEVAGYTVRASDL